MRCGAVHLGLSHSPILVSQNFLPVFLLCQVPDSHQVEAFLALVPSPIHLFTYCICYVSLFKKLCMKKVSSPVCQALCRLELDLTGEMRG